LCRKLTLLAVCSPRIGAVISELSSFLAQRGHDVNVLSTSPLRREEVSAAQNADIILTATYHGCLPAFRAGILAGKPRRTWSSFLFQRGRPLEEMFRRARIFLFPSKGETFGIALVEAMASGCAIISSVPLPFEGIRVAAGDARGLRDAIQELWNDPLKCKEMGKRNHALAQEYSWNRYTDRVVACLDQVWQERSTER
ncbi:MAG: hypothetical protein DLM73_05645, partial [Chthoniobacterales bacterium]